MATITINDITHRHACCENAEPGAYEVYDENEGRILALIAQKAAEAGHTLIVAPNSTGAATYRVSGEDEADEESAHDFMLGGDADFWRYL